MPTKQLVASLYGISPEGEVVHVAVMREAGVTYLSDGRGRGARHVLHPAARNYAAEAARVCQLTDVISTPIAEIGSDAERAAVESRAQAARRDLG
jgi:hypothetical protein